MLSPTSMLFALLWTVGHPTPPVLDAGRLMVARDIDVTTVCPSLDPGVDLRSRPVARDHTTSPPESRSAMTPAAGTSIPAIPTPSTGWSNTSRPDIEWKLDLLAPARRHHPVRPRAHGDDARPTSLPRCAPRSAGSTEAVAADPSRPTVRATRSTRPSWTTAFGRRRTTQATSPASWRLGSELGSTSVSHPTRPKDAASVYRYGCSITPRSLALLRATTRITGRASPRSPWRDFAPACGDHRDAGNPRHGAVMAGNRWSAVQRSGGSPLEL